MYSHNKKPIIYSGHSVYIASVVKTVIENFLLVTNSRIIHTRFNLCCVALKWATFFFQKLIIMKISKGVLSQSYVSQVL